MTQVSLYDCRWLSAYLSLVKNAKVLIYIELIYKFKMTKDIIK